MRRPETNAGGSAEAWRASATALALALAGVAQQQPGGVHLSDVGGGLGVEAERREEKLATNNGLGADLREWMTRETAELMVRGDVYHPALFAFAARVKGRLTQRDSVRSGETQALNEQDLQYELEAEVLREKPTNLSSYARRGQIERRQRFFATARGDYEESGADLRLGDLWVPTRLRYGQRTYEGSGSDLRFDRREVFGLDGGRQGELHTFDFDLEHDDVTQRLPDRAYRESRGRVSWTQRFVPRGHDHLRITGLLRRQEGDLESDLRDARADLHLEWSDSLTTDHGVALREARLAAGLAGRSDQTELYSTLRHRLYQSLDTMLGARLFESRLGAGRVDRDQLDASLHYRKTTPFGAVGFDWAPQLYEQDERNGDALVPVVGESHAVVAGVPVVLDNLRVLTSSLVVRDQTLTTVYAETIDYVVQVTGDRTELGFPVGSGILPGQTILVDYAFAAGTDRRYRSLRSDVGVSVEFGGWGSLRAFYGDERQTLLDGADEGSLGDSRTRGAQASVRGESYEVAAEYEDRANAFAPFERTEFRARKTFELSPRARLVAQASTYRTRFPDLDTIERGSRLSASWEWEPDATLRLHARGEYHAIDHRFDTGTGLLLEVGVECRVRALEILLDLRCTREEFDLAPDQDLLFAYLTVRRTF